MMFFKAFLLACLMTGFFISAQGQYAVAEPTGRLTSPDIREASGLVASLSHPGFLWTHNDSGDAARIFLLDSVARHRGTWYLQGVTARDWEEIDRLSREGVEYLIVADIGDNRARRDFVSIHVFPEPVLPASLTSKGSDVIHVDSIPAKQIQTWHLRYEDGPRDAEALFYDERDELLYVISKRELPAGIYTTKLPAAAHAPSDTLLLRRQGDLPLTWITAAALSPSGEEVLIKNLLQVFHWQRQPSETLLQTLQRPGTALPYRPEPQGEAITFAAHGRGYYTLSEVLFGLPVHLNYAKRTAP